MRSLLVLGTFFFTLMGFSSCNEMEIAKTPELEKPKVERVFYLEDNGEEFGKFEHAYDIDGHLIETRSLINTELMWRKAFEYNSNGLKSKSVTYHSFQTSTEYFEYNSDEQLIKHSVYEVNHDTNGVEGYKEQWHTEYIYKDERLDQIKHSNGSYSEYKYKRNGIVLIRNFNTNNELRSKRKQTYENGLLTKEVTDVLIYQSNESNKWTLEYGYNQDNLLLAKTSNGFVVEQNSYKGLKLMKKELFFDIANASGIIYKDPSRYTIYEY
ncbi:MAG: hypothetical protein JXQ87_18115 [Bacteroidia bacterium]